MARGTCSIPGCGRETIARGWCWRHWKRWRRHGDPLAGGAERLRGRDRERRRDRVASLFDQGMENGEIARYLGISISLVSLDLIARGRGVGTGGTQIRRRRLREDRIYELREVRGLEMTDREMAAELGSCLETAHRLRTGLGIPEGPGQTGTSAPTFHGDQAREGAT